MEDSIEQVRTDVHYHVRRDDHQDVEVVGVAISPCRRDGADRREQQEQDGDGICDGSRFPHQDSSAHGVRRRGDPQEFPLVEHRWHALQAVPHFPTPIDQDRRWNLLQT